MRRPTLLVVTVLALSAVAATASAQSESLSMTMNTTTLGGNFAPKNVVAVWVETSAGVFVKTIGRWSATRTSSLTNWIGASGQDNDAVSGATRINHNDPITVTWDFTDNAGAAVANGDYNIKVEVCEDNGGATNTVAVFPFAKDGNYRSVMDLADANVTNGTYDYVAATAPEDCVADGMCDMTCAAGTDPDCTDGTGDNPPAGGSGGDGSGSTGGASTVQGGCSAGSPASSMWGLLFLGLAVAFRRRRSRS